MNTDVLAQLSSEIFAEKQAFLPMGAARAALGAAGGGLRNAAGAIGRGLFTKHVPETLHQMPPGMFDGWLGRGTKLVGEHRAIAPGRIAATAGLAGFGGLHAANSAMNTEGTTMNPMTWFAPQSRQGVFDNSMAQFHSQQQQGNADLDQAYLHQGNPTLDNLFSRMTHGTPEQIQQQMADQTYTGNSWWNPSLGGLNPFANGSMSSNAERARGIQTQDESGLDRMRSRLASRGQSMNPSVRSNMEQQMASMRQRINTRIPRAGGGSSGGNQPPSGNWSNHVQPSPQQLSYFLNPNDYRNSPAPTTRIPWEQLASSSPVPIS